MFKTNIIQYYNIVIILLLCYVVYSKYYIFTPIFIFLIICINFKNFIVFFKHINQKS